ncbi:MAG TPA: proton-conducting transporter membrane subunit [Nitrospiria bacterium]|nr:proton-conducting transporter membrane subunit [Nitrospiria bacterium]
MVVHYYPLLISLAPLTAALLTALPGSGIGPKVFRVGVWAHAVAFGIALLVLREAAGPGYEPIRLPLVSSAWNGLLQFDLYIDRLAAVMMTLVTGVTLIIYLFAVRYMQPEHGRARFHTLLSLTTVVLLGMVTSANLLMLVLFWQLLSWLVSFLAFNYAHPPTAQGAFKTFTMLRVGDIAFLAGIVLAYHLYGTLDLPQLFARAAEAGAMVSLWPGGGLEIRATTAITLLIFVGAMSKSAQFPLHGWLPDSLYAPTPVHALLHAGIINAGGFLLNRLAPLYGLSPGTLHVVFAVGLLTALLGAGMMLTQNDIKKTLGYSTIGQMGYMIMECGLGAFALAVFHLIAHGLFKGTIFLNCGNVIHAARQEPRLPHQRATDEQTDFSLLTWVTGFAATLILPLIILLAAHGVLDLTFRDAQGMVIFLFFAWVTSSQAILTLYRLRAVNSPKVAALMLVTLLLVVVTYVLAGERFTYFLYPNAGEVAGYFHSAALPGWLFDLIVAVTALFVIMGWTLMYARSHGRVIRIPDWIDTVRVRVYLLLINRLYVDALSLRVGRRVRSIAHRVDRNALTPVVVGVLALGASAPALAMAADLPVGTVVGLVLAAILLPLFPLHGAYVAALTRVPGPIAVGLAFVLPIAGLALVMNLLPAIPAELLGGVGVLAVVGALYGSFKALVQARVMHLLAYAGLALLSIAWWHLAAVGRPTNRAVAFVCAVGLVIGGMCFAWQRVRARYGELDPDRISGLAQPMPRFAVLLALLVMAGVGLPPFGLFAGFFAMVVDPSVAGTWGLGAMLATWLAASWYLFKLIQRLLFGPHRADILYEDFRGAEVASLALIVLVLAALGVAPYAFLDADMLAGLAFSALDLSTWNP